MYSRKKQDKPSLYQSVERYIESIIETEALEPGDAIPSLTELMSRLDASALTIRRAIQELCQRQVLVTHQGRGTYVAGSVASRVLWVSGLDMFGGSASPYYSKLFRIALALCKERSIRLEPVWIPADRDFRVTVKAHGGEALIAGYIFVGCKSNHKLYDYVEETGSPHVSLSWSQAGKAWGVVPDFVAANRMAWEHLTQRGHRRSAAFLLGTDSKILVQAGFKTEDVYCIVPPSGNDEDVETCGYLFARKKLLEGTLSKALYLADDVLAKGVTRAILELASKRKGFDLVVRSNKGSVPLLGLPVTYLVFDLHEQVAVALDVLAKQIGGKQTSPVTHFCQYSKFWLPDADALPEK